jgi:outer membrane protein
VLLQKKLAEILSFAKVSFAANQAKFNYGKIDCFVLSAIKNQLLSAEFDLLKNDLQLQYTTIKLGLISSNQL